MKAQGKREARCPGLGISKHVPGLKGRNNPPAYYALSGLVVVCGFDQGRRASRLPLAIIFRACGADTFRACGADNFGACGADRFRAFCATRTFG